MTKTTRWLATRWLCLALLGAPALQAAAQDQSCIDNAVIACFDTCNDPNNFSECIIGCATGANGSRTNCRDQCIDDPTCLDRCYSSATAVQICYGATRKVDVVRGAIVLNRSTGVWQQSVRLTNNTALETLSNVVMVLDELASGWTLVNPDGITSSLAPHDSPYKEVAARLAPGQAVTVVLRFSRSGTPVFGYTPVVYNVPNR